MENWLPSQLINDTARFADKACPLPDFERLSVPKSIRDLKSMRIISRLYISCFCDFVVIVQYVHTIVSHVLFRDLREANCTRTG